MKANIAWDDTAELWNCLTCGARWLRMAISRCRCNGVLDGMLGQVKARDLIPGWPRGRSTSGAMRLSLARNLVVWAEYGGIVDDPRLREDIEAELTEERRKAEMMDRWQQALRNKRGIWNPDWWRSELEKVSPGEQIILSLEREP